MHALEAAERRASDGPLAGTLANGQPESWALSRPDPLQLAFEADLAAWLAWLKAILYVQADERAMRRMEFVCALGWTAVTLMALASLLLGVMALALSLALLALTLALAYAVTAPGPLREQDMWPEWSSLRPTQRACLVRIINLSRVAARPAGAQLLLSELEAALAEEPLKDWPPLRELRAVVQSGSALVQFELEP